MPESPAERVGKQAGVTKQASGAPEKALRIDVKGLTLRLLLSLVVPVGVALVLDLLVGTWPWMTLATALVCIPLATVIVGNATLRDFERVVAQVAPYDVPAEDDPAKKPADAAEADLTQTAFSGGGERSGS